MNTMQLARSVNNVSIQQAIGEAEQVLIACSDSAKLDGQLLLGFVLNKDTTYFFTWPEKIIETDQCEQFWQLVEQRLAGKPIAYLIGEQQFWSLDLAVAPSTLIPRPDTETLVELVLEQHANDSITAKKHITCLDLGTGTGAIALALASEQSTWLIHAVDYSDEAVELAKKNAFNHQLAQVNIYQSDWFLNVDSQIQFDIIVSNPPYIDENDFHLNEGDVRFEPSSALVADNNGYADLFTIIERAKKHFTAHGYLYLEHGFEQAKKVQAKLHEQGYVDIQTQQDLSGNDRVTYAQFITATA